VPSALPTRDRNAVLTQTQSSNSLVSSTYGLSYDIKPVTFTNLNGGSNVNWYLSVSIYGTGWGSNTPYATISVVTRTQGTVAIQESCTPTSRCAADRTYDGSAPFDCVSNYALLPSDLLDADGGSVTVKVTTVNVLKTQCNYKGSSLFVHYTLSASNPQPTVLPTPEPSSPPVQGGASNPTRSPSMHPTAPSPAPSPLPTTAPTSAPSPFPSYQGLATITRYSSSNVFDFAKQS
jgi:hypothetical protein